MILTMAMRLRLLCACIRSHRQVLSAGCTATCGCGLREVARPPPSKSSKASGTPSPSKALHKLTHAQGPSSGRYHKARTIDDNAFSAAASR